VELLAEPKMITAPELLYAAETVVSSTDYAEVYNKWQRNAHFK
jgi:hypothetical protein